MGVSFCDGITCFLEVTPDDTIVLDGPPDGVLRNFPWFLVLEDHLHDSWIFRLRVPPRERILFGTISFRCYRESLTMRIAVKAKKTQVFPSMPSVLFPEEAVSLCNACGEVFLHPGEYAMSSGGRFSGMVHLFGEKGSTVISSTREVARIEDAQNASFSNLTFLHRGIHKGNVVVVLGGRVTFDHCTFSGGVQEKLNWMGNGLVVAYGAEVVLRHCVFLDNQGAGVIVEKGSCLIVENSLFFRNGKEGV
ncbi:MAG: right-handed parallel beta-helix repeat-containing protein, partial [Atribacterota bacterium]|nr:right-handed parallel beta-helix repeat-containing protein [Atribacterota bacterium]